MVNTYISKNFNQIIKEKYENMKSSDQTEDFLDKEFFGDLKIFINPTQKINFSLTKTKSKNGDTIIIGSEDFI